MRFFTQDMIKKGKTVTLKLFWTVLCLCNCLWGLPPKSHIYSQQFWAKQHEIWQWLCMLTGDNEEPLRRPWFRPRERISRHVFGLAHSQIRHIPNQHVMPTVYTLFSKQLKKDLGLFHFWQHFISDSIVQNWSSSSKTRKHYTIDSYYSKNSIIHHLGPVWRLELKLWCITAGSLAQNTTACNILFTSCQTFLNEIGMSNSIQWKRLGSWTRHIIPPNKWDALLVVRVPGTSNFVGNMCGSLKGAKNKGTERRRVQTWRCFWSVRRRMQNIYLDKNWNWMIPQYRKSVHFQWILTVCFKIQIWNPNTPV